MEFALMSVKDWTSFISISIVYVMEIKLIIYWLVHRWLLVGDKVLFLLQFWAIVGVNGGWDHLIFILIPTMALTASKVSNGPVVSKGIITSGSCGIVYSLTKTTVQHKLYPTIQGIELQQVSNRHLSAPKLSFSNEGLSSISGKPVSFVCRRSSILCFSNGTQNTESKEFIRPYGDTSDVSR